tara:strand:- start:269 stop:598 length:330 start_codon:yes stop_codon:yes gene_type:complete
MNNPSEDKKKKHQIKIELEDNIGQGEYVNFAIVTHSPAEFVMDFIRVLPGMTKSKVKSRLIMAPMHAKTLMQALQDNIQKFENKFGEIKTPSKDSLSPGFKLPDDILPN